MPKVLVLFYSRSGSTAQLADAVAEGARGVRFTEVDVRRLEDLTPDATIAQDAAWQESREQLRRRYRTLDDVAMLADYDGLVLGSPTRHGGMAAELRHLLDQTGSLWSERRLTDRVGSAFTTVPAAHAGHETTLWSIMTPMADHGMILVPPGYTDPVMLEAGSPYGATATTATSGPTEAELAVARHQGARVARVAEWVRHAKSHHHH